MSEPTPAQMNCGYCLYGPPAICTCGTCTVDPADYEDDFEPDEDEEEFDCHLMPNGQCLAAGSEDCDWNCPYRDSEHYAGSKAWMRAKGSACQSCGADIDDGQEPGHPRTCRKCSGLGKHEDETGFDPADQPDAGGPAGR